MKKILMISGLVACVACPSFAAVTNGTDNCNYDTLGAYDGTVNLDADWTRNNLTLKWYNEGTEVTPDNEAAKSCDYDLGVTIPTNEPTKPGYRFNGWTVRGTTGGGTGTGTGTGGGSGGDTGGDDGNSY